MTAKYAFKQSIPIMAGYIVLGMGFGVLLESKGYGVIWAIAMSVFIYAGSMQDGECEAPVLWNFHAG